MVLFISNQNPEIITWCLVGEAEEGGSPAENTGFIVRSVCVRACLRVHVYSQQGGWDERGMLSVYDYVSCDPNAILGEYKHCCTLWLFRWGSARHPVRSGRGQISDHHSYPPTPLYTTDSLKYNIQFFLVYCHTPCGYHQDMQLSCKIVCIYLISMWWQNRYS